MVHVMSEVEKSDWDVPSNPVLVYADSYRDSARRGQKLADIWSVISDLERNIAPLWTAQRLRADTAEAELKRLDNLDTMQLIAELTNRNAAAEQRIAELRELLRLMTNEYAYCLEAGYDRITFLGGDCDSVSKMLSDNSNYAKACAALNPNPEAESHE